MASKEGLDLNAYRPLKEGETYEPFVSSQENPVEFTAKTLIAGILFGVMFGAANAYLGLYAGLTISTSIPVAVMTVAAFRALKAMGNQSSILEANLSQTIGSASSSLASGIIFTLPALFLWGLPPTLLQMTMLAMFGGLLGVLFMIPLRRFLIAREHGHLPYPEGTACAEVLVASEVGGSRAKNVFLGLGSGMLFKFLVDWLHLTPRTLKAKIPFLPKGEISLAMSSALFGVGYILGPRISTIMVGGGLLSSLVLIPGIAIWGADRSMPLFPETDKIIANMDAALIWTRYIRYIGAGAVATAGLVTLIKSIPTMIESFKIGLQQLKQRMADSNFVSLRTDDDLPLKTVGIGIGLIALVMALVPFVFGPIEVFGFRIAGAILVVIFAFFFVTVSSRIVGLVGVTSNPTSGMTIATLIGTSAIFLLLGFDGDAGKVAAITVGCIVAIAASIAGDTSQDLKTGFLIGATPRRQQMGELVGVLTSAVFVAGAVILLDQAYGFGGQELPAPQATLMKLVIEGIFDNALPWAFIGIGIAIALLCEVFKIPSLPFAVGVYLPLKTTFAVFLGGMLKLWLEKKSASEEEATGRRERGILFGSGLVGGEGLLGVGIAAVVFITGTAPDGIGFGWAGDFSWILALALFVILAWYFRHASIKS